MSFDEFRRRLQTERAFQELDTWTITAVSGGYTSPHTYRLRSGDKDYFVKEIKDNEREILKLLTPLVLTHVIKVTHPDLLDRNILVAEYVAGGPITSKVLEPGLIRDFATIQNHFNSPEFVQEPLSDDGGFFRSYLTRCFETGYNNLRFMSFFT